MTAPRDEAVRERVPVRVTETGEVSAFTHIDPADIEAVVLRVYRREREREWAEFKAECGTGPPLPDDATCEANTAEELMVAVETLTEADGDKSHLQDPSRPPESGCQESGAREGASTAETCSRPAPGLVGAAAYRLIAAAAYRLIGALECTEDVRPWKPVKSAMMNLQDALKVALEDE